MRYLLAALLLLASGSIANAFAASDVRVELKLPGTRFLVGQPIPYEVKVTNLSKTTLQYSYFQAASRLEPNHLIEVKDGSGKALPYLRYEASVDMKATSAALRPGESIRLKSFLNQWFVLDKPGIYAVIASWTPGTSSQQVWAKSRPVRLELALPTKAEKDALLAKARRQMEESMDPQQKADAVWILAYTLDSRAIADLVAAGQDDLVSQDVHNALQRFPDRKRVVDELLGQLRDLGPTEPLAYALENFGVPAAKSLSLLKSWLEKGAPEQRAAALLALSMIEERYKDPALRELILKQLKDPDVRVRREAVLALGNGGFGDTLDAVLELAKNDSDQAVRLNATTVLGLHRDDKAIPALKQLAGKGDRPIAVAAVESLQRIGSPAAIAALEEIAKGQDAYLRDLAQRELDQLKKP